MIASLTLFNVALALHIIGVVAAFGVVFAAPVAVPAARRASAGGTGAVAAAQLAVSQTLVRAGGLLILLTGFYMASKLDVFSEWWVSVPMVIIIVVLGLNDGYLVARYRKLVDQPDDAATAKQTDAVERVIAVLALVAILAMVLGPML